MCGADIVSHDAEMAYFVYFSICSLRSLPQPWPTTYIVIGGTKAAILIDADIAADLSAVAQEYRRGSMQYMFLDRWQIYASDLAHYFC